MSQAGEGILHILVRSTGGTGPPWPGSVAAGLGFRGADWKQKGPQEGPRSSGAQ